MTKNAATARRRIGILVEPHRYGKQQVIRALGQWAHRLGWSLFFADIGLARTGFADFQEMIDSFDGVIFDSIRSGMPEAPLSIPTVCISHDGRKVNAPSVRIDPEAVGRTAAEHLLERGFRGFLAFTTADPLYEAERAAGEAFIERVAPLASWTHWFQRGPRTQQRGRWLLADQLTDLAELLAEAPRPLGMLAGDADHAWRALIACERAGLTVPDDVALICAADEPTFLESMHPPISAVVGGDERVGEQAARTLAALFEGKRVKQDLLIPPREIRSRGSTDVLAIDDPDVLAAVRYIWNHVADQIQVADVVRATHISRRSLLRKCRAVLGRTPMEEIRRSRLETAKRLLIATDQDTATIAEAAGFGVPSQLAHAMRRYAGMSPLQLRRQFRVR